MLGYASGTGTTIADRIATSYGTTYTYNLAGKVVTTLDPVSAEHGLTFSVKYTYDALGRVVSVENASGVIALSTYDSAGNVIQQAVKENASAPAQILQTNTYNFVGNVLTQTDANGNTTTNTYNALGQIRSVTYPGDTSIPSMTTYTQYTRAALPSVSWTSAGVMQTYTYDNLGHLLSTSKKDAAGNHVITKYFRYDLHGNLRFGTDGNGTITEYTYSALHQLLTQTTAGKTTTYTYDANGNQLTVTDWLGNTTTSVYDALNRMIEQRDAYDIAVQTLTYDDASRQTSSTDALGRTTYFTYNANGSLQRLTYPDGSREDYTYTTCGQVETLTNRKADNTIIDAYTYVYDAAHNLTQKTDSKGITSYTYDASNRLLTVTEPSGKVTAYTFDGAGNRATQTETVGTDVTVTAYTYDALNRLTGSSETLNGILTQTIQYTYDNNGNQLQTILTTYTGGIPGTPVVTQQNTYDLRNQLIRTVTENGTIVENVYNGDGLRVEKIVNGTATFYLYEYQRVVLEQNSLGDVIGRNIYGTNLLMREVGADAFFYMYNAHADVTALLSTSGAIIGTYYYDAFGNILEQTGSTDNSILFAGYQYDKETGLYYLNARMYDPVTARFMQEDTYTGQNNDPLSLNLYTYCHNEPLMYSDPTGHKDAGMPGSMYGMPWDVQEKLQKIEKQKTIQKAKDSGEYITNPAEAAEQHNKEDEKILIAEREAEQRQNDIVAIANNEEDTEMQDFYIGDNLHGMPTEDWNKMMDRLIEQRKRAEDAREYINEPQHVNDDGVEVNAAGKPINEELFLEVLANTNYMSPELQAFYQAIPNFYGAIYGAGQSTTQCDCGGLARGLMAALGSPINDDNGDDGEGTWTDPSTNPPTTHEGRKSNRMWTATGEGSGTVIQNSPYYVYNQDTESKELLNHSNMNLDKNETLIHDEIDTNLLRPGDVIFFDASGGPDGPDGTVNHVATYVGKGADGKMIIVETNSKTDTVHFEVLGEQVEFIVGVKRYKDM